MKIRSPLLTKLAAWMIVCAFRLLFRTLKIDFRWGDPQTNPYFSRGEERFLFAVWHDEMVVPIFAGPHPCHAALVSRHQDGSFLAHALRMVGMKTVRGSTSHGGASAVRRLLLTAQKDHITITPDGPRGPRRKLKSGIVFLASHMDRAVIPTAYACVRCWRIPGSWTDLMIPRPFTTVYFVTGKPIDIPPHLSREQMERYTERLQQEMDHLNATAQRLARREVPAAVDKSHDHHAAA